MWLQVAWSPMRKNIYLIQTLKVITPSASWKQRDTCWFCRPSGEGGRLWVPIPLYLTCRAGERSREDEFRIHLRRRLQFRNREFYTPNSWYLLIAWTSWSKEWRNRKVSQSRWCRFGLENPNGRVVASDGLVLRCPFASLKLSLQFISLIGAADKLSNLMWYGSDNMAKSMGAEILHWSGCWG